MALDPEQAIRDINAEIEALREQKRAISARQSEVLETERAEAPADALEHESVAGGER